MTGPVSGVAGPVTLEFRGELWRWTGWSGPASGGLRNCRPARG